MSYDLNDAMDRLVAMEQEMISGSEAKGYPSHWQANMPYWTNNITAFEPGDLYGDDVTIRLYTFKIDYHRGYWMEGNYGEMCEAIWQDLPIIQDFFESNPGLTYTGQSTPLRYLDATETRLLPSPVLTKFDHGGTHEPQFGTTVLLRVVYNIGITRK